MTWSTTGTNTSDYFVYQVLDTDNWWFTIPLDFSDWQESEIIELVDKLNTLGYVTRNNLHVKLLRTENNSTVTNGTWTE